jgi:hypothetical protein
MLYASAVCVSKTPGRACIKPRSALAYPLAIIRIFNRWGTPMPGFKLLQAQLNGLSRAYIAYHGPKSLTTGAYCSVPANLLDGLCCLM